MKGALAVLIGLVCVSLASAGFYDFTPVDIDGKTRSLSEFEGRVCLVVNVATNWGETKTDYTQLTELQKKYNSSGLTVLGFPCNQFANQEPGTDAEIKAFAESYGILQAGGVWFHKIKVNFSPIPLYKWLKSQAGILLITWNFEKFLIGRDGSFIKHYGTTTDPLSFESDIVTLLNNSTLAK